MSTTVIPRPQEQVIPAGRNLFKAATLFGLLFASYFLTQWVAGAIEAAAWTPWLGMAVKWLFVAAMAVWHCALIIGMGILAHDAVHRVLFRSPFWNELGGGLLSAMALLPFYANRQFHLTHHSYAHQPGLDPENGMHHHSFRFAATAGSLVALALQYRILFQNLLRIGDPRYRERVILDLLFLVEAGVIYFGLVPALGLSLSLTVIPMLLLLPPVFAWRALSDHYGIPAIERAANKGPVLDVDAEAWHRDRDRRSREVSGWVVLTHPWLEWLWSHVNYHEVHHKYPWLSHVYLPGVFQATRDSQPYLVIHGYWRSFLRLRHRQYYDSREATRPFLSTLDW
jgi:fatty acid desaturase